MSNNISLSGIVVWLQITTNWTPLASPFLEMFGDSVGKCQVFSRDLSGVFCFFVFFHNNCMLGVVFNLQNTKVNGTKFHQW